MYIYQNEYGYPIILQPFNLATVTFICDHIKFFHHYVINNAGNSRENFAVTKPDFYVPALEKNSILSYNFALNAMLYNFNKQLSCLRAAQDATDDTLISIR